MSDIEMPYMASPSCETPTASTSSTTSDAAAPALNTSDPHRSDTSHSFDPSLFCPPQRRRVNPESLAARLGPVLVAELEKHITPGSIEMPPFSVRRDIQVNFSIDRRHIYDFYHSRGLRCLKDEKPAKKEVFFTEARPRPSRNAVPPASPPKPEPKRRRVAAVPAAVPAAAPKPVPTPRKNKIHRKRPYIMPSQEQLSAGHRFPTPEFTPLSPEDFVSIFDPVQDVFSTDRDILVVQPFGGTIDPRVLEGVPSVYDLSSLFSSSTSEASSVASSSSVSSYPSSLSGSSIFSPPATPEPTVFPLQTPFGFPLEMECVQNYAWLDCVLGPATGIQENVGSYKAYMDQQRNIYYEPFLETEQKSVAPDPPIPSTEYKSWLSSTKLNVRRAPMETPQVKKVDPLSAQGASPHRLISDSLDGMFPLAELHNKEDQTMQPPPSPVTQTLPRVSDIEPVEIVSCQQAPVTHDNRRESLAFFDLNIIQNPSPVSDKVTTHERRSSEHMGSPRRHRKESSKWVFMNGGNSRHARLRTCSGIHAL